MGPQFDAIMRYTDTTQLYAHRDKRLVRTFPEGQREAEETLQRATVG
jgi:hypothetical protein